MASSSRNRHVRIHSPADIDGIRQAAQATAWVRDQVLSAIRPGLSTLQLDTIAKELIAETGGLSAFYQYRGFPGQMCISLNDEVVHGIGRADRIIHPGDLVSIDVGVKLNGFIGDTAATVMAGRRCDSRTDDLLKATQESLAAGIAAARAGQRVNAIGRAVEQVIKSYGFSVVRDFVGHGCGRDLHEPPEVPNFASSHAGPQLQPGMVLAIEPMVNAGTHQVSIDSDGWTVRTLDGNLSAHFEHMILITDGEAEILTWPKKH